VDVRVLASTNRDLADRVSNGLFRDDLFYRINTIAIEPAAAPRPRRDIPLIARQMLRNSAVQSAHADQEGSTCSQYPWPGKRARAAQT